jgi:hypothetical protein
MTIGGNALRNSLPTTFLLRQTPSPEWGLHLPGRAIPYGINKEPSNQNLERTDMFDISKYALASSERLLSLFHEGFNVIDLAQPLRSLDEASSKVAARKLVNKEDIPVLGVRREGSVAGYLLPKDLKGSGDLSGFRKFTPEQLLDDTANLDQLFIPLSSQDLLFIEVLGEVACIVTHDDLEKPPMRMWLFGVITLVEMNVSWAVQELYPNNRWVNMISAARLAKAEELQEERDRRKQHASLLTQVRQLRGIFSIKPNKIKVAS